MQLRKIEATCVRVQVAEPLLAKAEEQAQAARICKGSMPKPGTDTRFDETRFFALCCPRDAALKSSLCTGTCRPGWLRFTRRQC